MIRMLPEFTIETAQGKKDMAHMFSDPLYRSWGVKLPYSSVNAKLSEDPKSEVTQDHVFSAQTVMLFLLSHPELWKDDFNKFLEYVTWGGSTIKVTKKENASLAKITGKVPTLKKYAKLNITLVCEDYKRGWGKVKGFPIKDMPHGWDEWELGMIAEKNP
jgi:hypothetical protein